jgi:ABC-type sugar transport system substrate-binding protein
MAVRKWKGLAAVAVVAVAALAVAACGSSSKSSSAGGASSGGSSSGGGTKLFMLPKFTGIPPFTQANQGAQQMASSFGYKLSYGGPTSASATQQVNFVNNAVSSGNKGIFISADNPSR